MFCRHCGKRIKDDVIYCTHCGAKVEEPTEETDVSDITKAPLPKALGSGGKPKTKQEHPVNKKKIIIVSSAIILFFVVLGTVTGILGYRTRGEQYIKTFIAAITDAHWDKAYRMLPESDRELLDDKSFQNTYQAFGLAKGTYKIRGEGKDEQQYEISFADNKGENKLTYQYTIEKQDKKRWLFFPSWGMTASDMVVRDTTMLVPETATVMIDNEPLETQSLVIGESLYEELLDIPAIYREKWLTLGFPAMWATEHTVKVVEDNFLDYETVWQPKEQTSLEVLEQQYIETEQWRFLYAEYIKSNLNTFTDVEWRASPYTGYGFFDVDEDGSPEMFTFEGGGTEAFYYHIYTLRDGQVMPYEQGTDSEIEDCFGGEMYITTDHRILVAKLSSAHEPARGGLKEYTIENGTITEKNVASYTFPMSTEDARYYYDAEDNKISSKKFCAILKEHGCDFHIDRIHIYGDALIDFHDITSLAFDTYQVGDLGQIDRDLAAYQLLKTADANTVPPTEDSRLEDDWCSGYKMLVPKEFISMDIDRNLTYFEDGVKDTVLVWGGCRREQDGVSEGYNYYPDGKSCLEVISGYPHDDEFSKAGDNYCCYSYVDEQGIIWYMAYHCDEELTYGFELRYSKKNKAKYDSLVTKLADYVTKNKGVEP